MDSTTMNSPSSSINTSTDSDNLLQSPQQVRLKQLRNAYVNIQNLERNVNNKIIDNLDPMIDKIDELNQEGDIEERIKDNGEVLLDSEIMTISSNVIKKCTVSLSGNISSYDPNELATKIRNYVLRIPDTISSDPDWSLLGKEVMKYFKTTAKFTMILGTLRPIPKKEVVRRKIVKESQAPIKRPEKVIVLDKVEDSVEHTVEEIRKIIIHYQKQNKKPLDFFALVLHPTSFGKTIENILHVSFLVRDGFIQFVTDEDGVPQVQKTSKKELEKENENKRNIQNVVPLNMNQWKALVEAYGIETPMIDLSANRSK